MAKEDYDLIDSIAAADGFVLSMVTEPVCQDICVGSHHCIFISLQLLAGRYLGNVMTSSDNKRMEFIRHILFKACYFSLQDSKA